MRHLDRRQRFDHDVGMALLQATEHVEIVGQRELRVETADDVKFARWVFEGRVRLREDFLEAARVGAIFFRHTRERAENTGVAQDADVRRIDVLIGREIDAVAVLATVREVCQATDGQQVGGCKKREAILAREPLAAFHFRGNRDELRIGSSACHTTLRTASVTLCPPNPNELDSATSTCRSTAWFGAESRSQAGSALN